MFDLGYGIIKYKCLGQFIFYKDYDKETSNITKDNKSTMEGMPTATPASPYEG